MHVRHRRPHFFTTWLTACLLLLAAPSASAVFFALSGQVTDCNNFACNLANIAVGDQIAGFIEVDDAAAGPNSTFTEVDILSARLVVGTLDSGVTNGPFGTTSLTTDGAGEIVAGNALLTTDVDTGLGTATVEIVLDASLSTWDASTDFFGLGQVAAGTLNIARCVAGATDSDGDCVADVADNCSELVNPDQRDTNGDGFGNACDPDLNNDGIVNTIDLGRFRSVFFTADPDADFNGDGVVNTVDLGVLRAFFFGPPGPSGLAP